MHDTSFSWQLVSGDIRIQSYLGSTPVEVTWSGKAPSCEYFAKSSGNIRKVYFFAGRSIDIVAAILKELLEELDNDLFQSIGQLLRKRQHEKDDEPSRKRQHAVLHALLRYLSPIEYPHLTIFCIDKSYWRFPGALIADPDEPPSAKDVMSMPMPHHTTFKPRDWLRDALPDATEAQIGQLYGRYQVHWTKMDRQQHQEMMKDLERLSQLSVDFKSIPLEADEDDGKSDQDLIRDRKNWVMEHGQPSSSILQQLVYGSTFNAMAKL